MSIKTFPQVVFISVVNPGTLDEFLSASLNTTEALGDENSQEEDRILTHIENILGG